MGMLERLRRLLRANLNEMLASVEAPEAVVAQLIRDTDAAILDLRGNTATVIAAHKLTERRLEQARRAVDKWQAHAETAIRDGNDSLACQALRRKHGARDQAAVLAERAGEEQELLERLRHTLREAEEKIQELRAKRDTLLAKHRALDARRRLSDSRRKLKPPDAIDRTAAVVAAAALDDEIAELDAWAALTQRGPSAPDLQTLQDLQEQDTVEAELQRLRQRLQSGPGPASGHDADNTRSEETRS